MFYGVPPRFCKTILNIDKRLIFHNRQSNLSALLKEKILLFVAIIIPKDILRYIYKKQIKLLKAKTYNSEHLVFLGKFVFRMFLISLKSGGNMFKELIYTWLFKAIEIVLVAILGYFVFILIEQTFNTLTAIVGLSIVFYFFGSIIAPYIKQLRKWIYTKITGIDKEEF